VFRDRTRREVDVQVARERPEPVGVLDTGLPEDVLTGAVPVDHLEVGVAGVLGPVTVAFDQRDLVTLLPEDTGSPESHTTGTNDNEPHTNGYATGYQ